MNLDFKKNLLMNEFLFKLFKTIFILFSTYLINIFLQFFLKKWLERRVEKKFNQKEAQRIKTLSSFFGQSAKFLIWLLAILMILSEFRINIGPILAGLGLIGFAIGMAARDLISDFISGIFIILEDQYRVGDKIKISGFEGEVIEITLRRTVIKDKEGFFHLFPNSQIKIVSKQQKNGN